MDDKRILLTAQKKKMLNKQLQKKPSEGRYTK